MTKKSFSEFFALLVIASMILSACAGAQATTPRAGPANQPSAGPANQPSAGRANHAPADRRAGAHPAARGRDSDPEHHAQLGAG